MGRIKMLKLHLATANISTATPLSSARQRQGKRYLATNDRRWLKIRKAQLDREPLCRMCGEKGIAEPATVADHIDGRAACEWDFRYENLQSLCAPCHGAKTAAQTTGQDVPELPGPPTPRFTIA